MRVAGTRSSLLPRWIAASPARAHAPTVAAAAEKGEGIPLSPLALCVTSAPPIPHRHLLAYGFLGAPSTRSVIPRSPAQPLSMVMSGGRLGHRDAVWFKDEE